MRRRSVRGGRPGPGPWGQSRVAGGLVVVLLAAACGGGTSDPQRDGAEAGDEGAAGDYGDACAVEALDEAVAEDGPVEITFWHAMTEVPAETLERMVREFNGSQDRVQVDLVGNNSYRDQREKYLAGLTTGDLPDLVQHQEIFLQEMIDTETALPVQACIEAGDYDTSDYVPRTISYYEVDGVQWALPFNVNTAVLLYDRVAFEDAGLDPDDPPATFDELQDAAEALTGAGMDAGMGLKRDGWLMEQFLALRGEPLVDNGNGRDGRATEVLLGEGDAAEDVFTELDRLVRDGLAVTNPTEGPNSNTNLLGLGAGQFAMTFDSSGVLGVAAQLLADEQYPDVEPGVAPLPGRTDDGGVLIGGGSLYISSDDPVRQAAAWELATYLTSPESQSVWAAETGFVPVRQSAVELPEIQERWQEMPWFQVAYDQLLAGAENEATAGPVMGDYLAYRDLMEEIQRRLFEGELTPEEAVDQASEQADELLESYNERIGI